MAKRLDAPPASIRAQAEYDAQRYNELRKTGAVAAPAPAPSPPADEEEEEEEEASMSSDDISLDSMDLDPSSDAPVNENGLVDNDPHDAFDPSSESSSDAAADDDDAAAETPSGDEAMTAARTRLRASYSDVMHVMLADVSVQDTIRTFYLRRGRRDAAEKLPADVDRDLLLAIRVCKEHILRILVAPPGASGETSIAKALVARAKNSRDLRRALDYMDAFLRPTRKRFIAYAVTGL